MEQTQSPGSAVAVPQPSGSLNISSDSVYWLPLYMHQYSALSLN